MTIAGAISTVVVSKQQLVEIRRPVIQFSIEDLRPLIIALPPFMDLVCGALSPAIPLETGKLMELSAGNLDEVDDAMLGRILTQI